MVDKDAYVQKLHAKLDEWNAEIDKLKAKADAVEADKRAAYQSRIQDLQEKRDQIEKNASELQSTGAGAWDDLKLGVEEAWSTLEAAVKDARNRFK